MQRWSLLLTARGPPLVMFPPLLNYSSVLGQRRKGLPLADSHFLFIFGRFPDPISPHRGYPPPSKQCQWTNAMSECSRLGG